MTRYICATGVFTPEKIQERLALEVENYRQYGVQYFPIFHLETGDLIGCCGLRPQEEPQNYELGFHLQPQYWRQGYGYEAASAMVDYGFSTIKAKEIWAGHNPYNLGSKALLSKLGFKYVKDTLYPATGLRHPTYVLYG